MYAHVKSQRSIRIIVVNDVIIAKGEAREDSERTNNGNYASKVRFFRRWLSMLVPASVLFTAWAGFSPDLDVYKSLRFHEKAMQVWYDVKFLISNAFDLHPVRAVRNGLKNRENVGGCLRVPQRREVC